MYPSLFAPPATLSENLAGKRLLWHQLSYIKETPDLPSVRQKVKNLGESDREALLRCLTDRQLGADTKAIQNGLDLWKL